MPKPPGLIAIGELARRTGLASSALRYYERVGLMAPAARAGGRRAHGASGGEGGARVAAGSRRRPWVRFAQAKLRELDSLISRAERARALVQHALACPHPSLITCPNFRAELKGYLDSPERPGHSADEKAVRGGMHRRSRGARGVTGT